MLRYLGLIVGALVVAIISGESAMARPQYKKVFDDKYVPDAPLPVQEAIKTAACNICHVKDKPKTQRNAYGEGIQKALEKATWDGAKIKAALGPGGDRAPLLKDLEKILQEMEKVKDPDGKPYGEQVKAGNLPK